MTKIIENQILDCKRCKKKTMHARNNSKTSGFMILIHILLILGTAGLWLIPLIIYKVCSVKVGGFECMECVK